MKNPIINLSLNVTKSENQEKIIVDWETRDKQIGGSFDLTDFFLVVMDYMESKKVYEHT